MSLFNRLCNTRHGWVMVLLTSAAIGGLIFLLCFAAEKVLLAR